jgi:hypothetical protein
MTTHPSPPATVHLGEPGALLAALPALLGFHPEHSIVLLCLEGERAGSVGLVARVDLPARSDRAGAAAVVEQLSVLCARRVVPAAVAVVVEDAEPPDCRRYLVRALRTACEAVGTDLVAAHHVPRTAAGVAWSSYGSSRTGLLPDPRSSPVATEHVLRGRVIRRSRAEVDAVLTPDAPERTGRVGLALDEEHARVQQRRASGPAGCSRALLERVVGAVARAAEDSAEPLGAAEIAALGAALCDLPVRDACIALAGGEHADAAERLWTELVRALPAPELAEPAVLLAHSAYARGEGPMAGVALQVALEADPAHRMAGLLSASLGAGLPPGSVRALSSTAHGIAAELGVTLPPVDWQ